MHKEIEVKFKIDNKKQLEKKLKDLGWTKGKKIHSVTYGFFSNNSIKKGIFPRIRVDNRLITFTVKFRKPDNKYFLRDEYTLKLNNTKDIETIKSIFNILGYAKVRTFEKYRNIWSSNIELEICTDKLPFGDYIEIEGRPKDIEKMIKTLKLKGERITKAYLGVYEDYCKINNLPIKNDIVF